MTEQEMLDKIERLLDALAELADSYNYFTDNMPLPLWGGSDWKTCTTPDKFARKVWEDEATFEK